MTRPPVRGRLLLWLVGSAAGGLLLALPDSGPRLFSFSRTHGPSLVDLLGMVIAVVSWLPVVWLISRHRSALRGGAGRGSAGLAVAGVVLLVVTIRGDLGLWWLAPVTLLVAAQLIALVSIARESFAEHGPRHRPPDVPAG
ncbi:hypothetical protein [Micromonospora sp. NPDC093277]|uniref:hypothetical protein n=1 Tax=Micromonospora sp. NPDC093277 TaxID=3364291 RepID=UPI0038293973